MATSALAAAQPAGLLEATLPNSKAAIEHRAAAGKLSWTGPLMLVFGRTVLCVLAQVLASAVFWVQGNPTPWQAASPYWTVWATLADLGCLAGLYYWTRREGLRLADLFSFDRRGLGRHLLLAAGILIVAFPVCIIGGALVASVLVFGTTEPPLYSGELMGRVLPLWGRLYSALLWWPLWSATEELTYNGYALPRLEVLTRRRWLAVALVALLWAAQHAALPTIFEGQYLVWKTLEFVPLALVLSIIYLRTRRLVPLVIAHWAMDFFGVMYTIVW